MLETILVIDDDAETTQSIALALESMDYLVFSAGGEDTAIIMAGKVKPGLIFINPAVAGGKGLEICKRIHGMEQLKNVPIIVLSAFDGARDPHFTALYGIVDSLQKPFSHDDLFVKTRDALSVTPSDMQPAADIGTAEELIPQETPETSESPHEDVEQLSPPVNQPDYGPERETSWERKSPYASKRTIRRTGVKTRLPVALVAAAAIIVLGAVGFMFYNKGALFETKAQKTATAKSDQPPQQTAQVRPSQGTQTHLADAKSEPSAKPEVAAASPVAPVPLPKPETPAVPPAASNTEVKSKGPATPAENSKAGNQKGKAVYSVQVGVFKNKKNASALTKRYDKKGYEAFMHKTPAGEKIFLYRVLIGKFASKREAADWAKKISAEEHIKTTIFKQ